MTHQILIPKNFQVRMLYGRPVSKIPLECQAPAWSRRVPVPMQEPQIHQFLGEFIWGVPYKWGYPKLAG